MYPIRFESICQSYVWGKELWEISDRKEGMSIVAEGPWKGQTLHSLMTELGPRLVGKARHDLSFPLLIKKIEAKGHLSMQVHPDEGVAKKLGGEAKHESWVFLKEGTVYAGLKSGISQEKLLDAIREEKVVSCAQMLTVQKGDAVYIPAGCIHAILAGSHLLEVQQNSNTTYRIYDWGRTHRELHIDQALQAIHWHGPQVVRNGLKTVIHSPHFTIDRMVSLTQLVIPTDPRTFQILFCEEGEGIIEADGSKTAFSAGMTHLIPAMISSLSIEGKAQMIRIHL